MKDVYILDVVRTKLGRCAGALSTTGPDDPRLFGIGPVEAGIRALGRARVGWSALSAVELNEAFAARALACLAEWPELDPDLHGRGGGYGLAAIRIGVGQGLAMVIGGR